MQKPGHVSISSWVISLCGLILFPSLTVAPNANSPTALDTASDHDMLIYVVKNYGESANAQVLYDPDADVRTPITGIKLDAFWTRFSFSSDRQLAYMVGDRGDADIYMWDSEVADAASVNITASPGTDDVPLGWSPDGRYLAFTSAQAGQSAALYLWDGATVTNITSDSGATISGVDVAWGADNQLAFTAWFTGSAGAYSGEVYLWNGEQVLNVSQNPTAEDRAPAWSADGRLAFLSARNGEDDIFVWDGVSMKNGLPDRDTFVNVAPERTGYYSYPTWTNDGRLAFTGTRSGLFPGASFRVGWANRHQHQPKPEWTQLECELERWRAMGV